MQNTSDTTFQEDISKATLTLVDFWAEWCGPCRILHPILEEIAAENDDIRILSLDIDQNPDTAREYGVQSIPTIIFFQNGKELDRAIGAMPKKALLAKIKEKMA